MRATVSIAALLLALTAVAFGQADSEPRRDVLSVDREWATYATRNDEEAKTALGIILADDYTFTGTGSTALTKAEYMKQADGTTTFETEDVKARRYGGAAVVTGRIHLGSAGRATLRRQYPVSYDSVRYTNVYVNEGGKWRLVSTQFTPIFERVR